MLDFKFFGKYIGFMKYFTFLFLSLLTYSFVLAGSECENDQGFMSICSHNVGQDIPAEELFLCFERNKTYVGSACASKLDKIMKMSRYNSCKHLSASGDDNPFEKCLSS